MKNGLIVTDSGNEGNRMNYMSVLWRMPTIQYSAQRTRLYLTDVSFGPFESSAQTASRSLQPYLQGSLNDRPTDRPIDHATRSVTTSGIYVRSTMMWSNNNCSICRLLDWFPCFYLRTEQGNRRQQVPCVRWGTLSQGKGAIWGERSGPL